MGSLVHSLQAPIDRLRVSATDAVNSAKNLAMIGQPASVARSISQIKHFAPREDQQDAIKSCVEGFNSHNRGQLLLPCGAGKTLTSLWIKEKLPNPPKRTLVLVPSTALIKQTKDNWNSQRKKDFDTLCICGDDSVGDEADKKDTEALEELKKQRTKVTTDAQEIQSFLASTEDRDSVVYCTYQSYHKLMEVAKKSKVEFDLAIIDEAHKTTGIQREDKARQFSLVLDDNNLKIHKRLFMTATPRVSRVRSNDSAEVFSMHNEDIYGPEFYRMNFARAIELGILTDYKIIVVKTEPRGPKELFQQSGLDPNEKMVGTKVLGLEKVMEGFAAKRALTFHSTRQKARNFQTARTKIFPDFDSFYIDGSDNVKTRNGIIDQFKKSQNRTSISNARCLTEGIDVPGIDTIMFADPKGSEVDIVQALGRAIRIDRKDPSKQFGYVVIPCESNEDGTINDEAYTGLTQVLASLADHDDRLEAKINSSNPKTESEDAEREAKESEEQKPPEIIVYDSDQQHEISPDILKAIRLEVLLCSKEAMTGSRYDSFEEAKAVVLAQSPNLPTNLAQFFTEETPVPARQLMILAQKEGLIDRSFTAVIKARKAIADQLWSVNTSRLEEITSSILKFCSTRDQAIGCEDQDFVNLLDEYNVFSNEPLSGRAGVIDRVYGTSFKTVEDLFDHMIEKRQFQYRMHPKCDLISNSGCWDLLKRCEHPLAETCKQINSNFFASHFHVYIEYVLGKIVERYPEPQLGEADFVGSINYLRDLLCRYRKSINTRNTGQMVFENYFKGLEENPDQQMRLAVLDSLSFSGLTQEDLVYLIWGDTREGFDRLEGLSVKNKTTDLIFKQVLADHNLECLGSKIDTVLREYHDLLPIVHPILSEYPVRPQNYQEVISAAIESHPESSKFVRFSSNQIADLIWGATGLDRLCQTAPGVSGYFAQSEEIEDMKVHDPDLFSKLFEAREETYEQKDRIEEVLTTKLSKDQMGTLMSLARLVILQYCSSFKSRTVPFIKNVFDGNQELGDRFSDQLFLDSAKVKNDATLADLRKLSGFAPDTIISLAVKHKMSDFLNDLLWRNHSSAAFRTTDIIETN